MINPPLERFDIFEKKIAVRKVEMYIGICTECKECHQPKISFVGLLFLSEHQATNRENFQPDIRYFVFNRTSLYKLTEPLSWT